MTLKTMVVPPRMHDATNPTPRQAKLETRVLVILSAILVAYVAARAALMSITYDEALTYLWHVRGRVGDIVRFATPGLPDNNHILLTLAAKLSTGLFGPSEFALRLPSVLCFALFCAAAACILRRHLHGPLLVLFFLFTTLNPYVIDMMSVARGYGPGIALATSGTYALMRALQPSASRTVWASASAGAFALAVLAHLTFLLPCGMALVTLLTVLLLDYWRTRTSFRALLRVASGPALVSALLAPFVLMQIHTLAPLGLLMTEGSTSFFVDSIQPVVTGSLDQWYSARGEAVTALCIFAYLLPACGVFLLLLPRRITQLNTAARTDIAVLLALLLGAGLLSVLQHDLAGVAYLAGRRALLLFVFFALLCGSMAAACGAGARSLRRTALPALLAVVLPLTASFVLSANLHRTRDWFFTADIKTMLADLAALGLGSPAHPARLGIYKIFDSSINYYRIRDRLTWLSPVDRSGPLGRFDAYYIFANDLPELQHATGPLRVLRHYSVSDTIFAVPQTPFSSR